LQFHQRRKRLVEPAAREVPVELPSLSLPGEQVEPWLLGVLPIEYWEVAEVIKHLYSPLSGSNSLSSPEVREL
jgi:hypothetical protein